MKNIKLAAILLILIVSVNKSAAQFVVAGTVSVNDTYFDIIPDTVLYALNVHITPYPGESVLLDLNIDGIDDVKIFSYGGGGLGGGQGACKVNPLNPALGIKMHDDTSNSFNGPIIFKATNIFNFGDTIQTGTNYISTTSYMWSTTYGAAAGPSHHDWDTVGEKYIGFRFSYAPNNIRYGWIRVEAYGSGIDFELTIKDFVINNNTNVGLGEIQNTGIPLVYPNPFNTELTIEMNTSGDSEIQVYDIISRQVNQKKFNQNTKLNTSQLVSGIYFYKIINSGAVVGTGKIIKE